MDIKRLKQLAGMKVQESRLDEYFVLPDPAQQTKLNQYISAFVATPEGQKWLGNYWKVKGTAQSNQMLDKMFQAMRGYFPGQEVADRPLRMAIDFNLDQRQQKQGQKVANQPGAAPSPAAKAAAGGFGKVSGQAPAAQPAAQPAAAAPAPQPAAPAQPQPQAQPQAQTPPPAQPAPPATPQQPAEDREDESVDESVHLFSLPGTGHKDFKFTDFDPYKQEIIPPMETKAGRKEADREWDAMGLTLTETEQMFNLNEEPLTALGVVGLGALVSLVGTVSAARQMKRDLEELGIDDAKMKEMLNQGKRNPEWVERVKKAVKTGSKGMLARLFGAKNESTLKDYKSHKKESLEESVVRLMEEAGMPPYKTNWERYTGKTEGNTSNPMSDGGDIEKSLVDIAKPVDKPKAPKSQPLSSTHGDSSKLDGPKEGGDGKEEHSGKKSEVGKKAEPSKKPEAGQKAEPSKKPEVKSEKKAPPFQKKPESKPESKKEKKVEEGMGSFEAKVQYDNLKAHRGNVAKPHMNEHGMTDECDMDSSSWSAPQADSDAGMRPGINGIDMGESDMEENFAYSYPEMDEGMDLNENASGGGTSTGAVASVSMGSGPMIKRKPVREEDDEVFENALSDLRDIMIQRPSLGLQDAVIIVTESYDAGFTYAQLRREAERRMDTWISELSRKRS